jgi:hypothetical protein
VAFIVSWKHSLIKRVAELLAGIFLDIQRLVKGYQNLIYGNSRLIPLYIFQKQKN